MWVWTAHASTYWREAPAGVLGVEAALGGDPQVGETICGGACDARRNRRGGNHHHRDDEDS